MIIRKIDGDNDWEFGLGLSDYAKDEEAVAENIQTRVLSWVNDCFFALNEGVDWKARLDVGQQSALLEEVKNVILQSFGVVTIIDVEAILNKTTRLYTIRYDIQTIYSPSFQSQIEQSAGVNFNV